MNTSEQLYHLTDTVAYMNEKLDKEIRLIKSLLRKILEKMGDNNNENVYSL